MSKFNNLKKPKLSPVFATPLSILNNREHRQQLYISSRMSLLTELVGADEADKILEKLKTESYKQSLENGIYVGLKLDDAIDRIRLEQLNNK